MLSYGRRLEKLFEPAGQGVGAFRAFRDSATRTARVALFVFERLDFGSRICYLFHGAVRDGVEVFFCGPLAQLVEQVTLNH